MSSPWFHAPQLPSAGMILALDRDEAKHAVGVRRLSSGDAVTIFDGMGGIAHAVLTGDRNSDGGVLVRVDRVERISRTGTDLLVGVAPPKGDRFSTMLDMLGQLGVTGIVPLETDHGVIDAAAINRTRAERILLEACKQSRGAWLPSIAPAMTVANFVRLAASSGRTVLIADQGGVSTATCTAERVAVAIGPEGGFSAAELAVACTAGAVRVDLGPAILRVEAAAVSMAAAFRARPTG